jgi:hypothetical protein
MGEVVTGGCLCGAVRFEVELPFRRANACHCSRCRRHSGSAFLVGSQAAWETLPDDGLPRYEGRSPAP